MGAKTTEIVAQMQSSYQFKPTLSCAVVEILRCKDSGAMIWIFWII